MDNNNNNNDNFIACVSLSTSILVQCVLAAAEVEEGHLVLHMTGGDEHKR